MTKKDIRWHKHFLGMALYHSRMSKDPSTRVGCVIVGPDREILSGGFNGFPRGIADTDERLNDRDTKLKLIVHAELNAILAAAKKGVQLDGSTLYLAAHRSGGREWWGGPPCTRCTVEIAQAGIRRIVSAPLKADSKWHDDLKFAIQLIAEAEIEYLELPIDAPEFGALS